MASFVLVIADKPFTRDVVGTAPYIETIEHGASNQRSTPATKAYKLCLDAMRGDDAHTLASDLRGALSVLIGEVEAAVHDHEAAEGDDKLVWRMIDLALKRAWSAYHGFRPRMGSMDPTEVPLPWHVAEFDVLTGACVRAANGNIVFRAEKRSDAEVIVARMNETARADPEAVE